MSQVILTTPDELQKLVSAAVQSALVGVSAPIESGKRFLDEEEAAIMMSTTASSLRTRRCRGRGPVYTKDGSRIIYDARDIEAYLQARKVKTRGN